MHRNWAVVLVLVAAALVRLNAARERPYVYDEDRLAIPIARSISFSPDNLNLPLRGPHHPALPYYFVKISGAVFGETKLGYRMVHLLSGIFTIFLISVLARQWFGAGAATWAAALLAFNEYHIGVSAYATAKSPHLLFLVLAIYAFSRFLATERPGYLHATGGALALAFYCKEHSALLMPVFLMVLLFSRHRHWFRSPHPYLAAVLFFAIISPDILWNVMRPVADRASYGDNLSRIGGIGFSPYPFLFFAHHTIRWVYLQVTGTVLNDEVAENPSMNAVLGLLLLALVCYRTARRQRGDVFSGFLLTLFWFVLVFFVSIRPGEPTFTLDPVAWYWVDVILFPAVILSGSVLATIRGRWRLPLYALACAGMVGAVARTTIWWPFVSENI
jgi:4-amino-4-deoxy-L-arabinose transferase-like glycosyltransferase